MEADDHKQGYTTITITITITITKSQSVIKRLYTLNKIPERYDGIIDFSLNLTELIKFFVYFSKLNIDPWPLVSKQPNLT